MWAEKSQKTKGANYLSTTNKAGFVSAIRMGMTHSLLKDKLFKSHLLQLNKESRIKE